MRPRWYSRAVRILKIGLPLVALGLISTVFLLPEDDLDLPQNLLDELAESSGLEPGILTPRFSGLTADGQPYAIMAARAVPEILTPNTLALEELNAALEDRSGLVITLSAPRGTLDLNADILMLEGGLQLERSDGALLTTARLTANLRTGAFDMPQPVTLTGPFGQIQADSARRVIETEGDQQDMIWLDGAVRVRLNSMSNDGAFE